MIEDHEIEDFLEHFGVKGMKWGVRNDNRTPGVPRKTDREAKKDAGEFARAKMFYGTGAGTRRKLIRESVNAKSARDPLYKKAFDNHLSKQDLSTHATKAVRERKRTDRTTVTKQRAGYLARTFSGESGNQAAFAAVVVAGATYLNTPQGRARMSSASSRASAVGRNLMKAGNNNPTADFLKDYIRRNS